jgi:hypothetical protein
MTVRAWIHLLGIRHSMPSAPKHHKVIFENERLRVLEVTLEPNDEEPIHHHRWPSVFVFDKMQGPVHDCAPDGTKLPPIDCNPAFADAHGVLAAASAYLGRMADARASLDVFASLIRGSLVDQLSARPFRRPADRERYLLGLYKAGLPEL